MAHTLSLNLSTLTDDLDDSDFTSRAALVQRQLRLLVTLIRQKGWITS